MFSFRTRADPRLRIRSQFCVHWNDYKQVFVHEDIFGLLKTFKREEFFIYFINTFIVLTFFLYVYRINLSALHIPIFYLLKKIKFNKLKLYRTKST